MSTLYEAQFAGGLIGSAVTVADLDMLRTLTPERLEEQRTARAVLVRYATVVWEQAKQRGEDPANNPLYAGIGSLRDLMITMQGYADDPHGNADQFRIDTAEGRDMFAQEHNEPER